MKFSKGDKILCVDAVGWESRIIQEGHIYTFNCFSNDSEELMVTELDGYSFFSERFRLHETENIKSINAKYEHN